MNEQAPVLLYDGVCALCNGAVKKILRDDKVGSMRFAALDSEYGTQVIDRHPELAGVDSFVIVDNPGGPDERTHIRSDAVLRVIDYLGGARRASLIGRLVPRPIRDSLYRLRGTHPVSRVRPLRHLPGAASRGPGALPGLNQAKVSGVLSDYAVSVIRPPLPAVPWRYGRPTLWIRCWRRPRP